MNHKQKVKLARRLRTKEEAIKGVSIFDSANWNKRKAAIAERVKKQQSHASAMAAEKRAKKAEAVAA